MCMSEVKSSAMTLGVLGGVLLALSTTVPSFPLSLGVFNELLPPIATKTTPASASATAVSPLVPPKGVPGWLAALCTVGGSVGWILVACAVARAAALSTRSENNSSSGDKDDDSAYWSIAIVLGVFLALCRGFLSRKWLRGASRLNRQQQRRRWQPDGGEGADDADDTDDASDEEEPLQGSARRSGVRRSPRRRHHRHRDRDGSHQASPYQSVFVVFALYILCAAGLGVLSALTTSDRCLVVSRILLMSTIPVAEVVAAAPWAARGTDRLVSIAPVFLVLSLLTTTVVNIE